MCGLTGVAVHPVHGNVKLALKMLPALLRSIEKRGSHATGIAVLGGSDPFILKAAVPATEFVKSVPFNDAMQGRVLKQATPSVFLGHTRHAFVAGGENNAHRDDCAHPFSEGRVIGAHNGVIYNWRALEQQLPEHTPYEVDSQVIFGLLNQKPSPADALEALEGYFALSWMKHGSLFLASSSAGSLYAAYMQRQRMLVWHSEQRELLDMLLSFGIKAKHCSLGRISPGSIFEYVPLQFSHNTTMGGRQMRFKQNVNDFVKPQRKGKRAWSSGYSEQEALFPEVLEDRGKRSVVPYTDSEWDMVGAREVWKKPKKATPATTGQLTLLELQERIAKLEDTVADLRWLVEQMVDRGYAEDATAFAQGQATMSCVVCKEPGTVENMLALPADRYIHASCVADDVNDPADATGVA